MHDYIAPLWTWEDVLKITLTNHLNLIFCEEPPINPEGYNWEGVESLVLLSIVTEKPIIMFQAFDLNELSIDSLRTFNTSLSSHKGREHQRFQIENFHRPEPKYITLHSAFEHYTALIQSNNKRQLEVPNTAKLGAIRYGDLV